MDLNRLLHAQASGIGGVAGVVAQVHAQVQLAQQLQAQQYVQQVQAQQALQNLLYSASAGAAQKPKMKTGIILPAQPPAAARAAAARSGKAAKPPASALGKVQEHASLAAEKKAKKIKPLTERLRQRSACSIEPIPATLELFRKLVRPECSHNRWLLVRDAPRGPVFQCEMCFAERCYDHEAHKEVCWHRCTDHAKAGGCSDLRCDLLHLQDATPQPEGKWRKTNSALLVDNSFAPVYNTCTVSGVVGTKEVVREQTLRVRERELIGVLNSDLYRHAVQGLRRRNSDSVNVRNLLPPCPLGSEKNFSLDMREFKVHLSDLRCSEYGIDARFQPPPAVAKPPPAAANPAESTARAPRAPDATPAISQKKKPSWWIKHEHDDYAAQDSAEVSSGVRQVVDATPPPPKRRLVQRCFVVCPHCAQGAKLPDHVAPMHRLRCPRLECSRDFRVKEEGG
eukprot:Hpha_TRINITY_DN15753_c4_g17::TRINITY_DN15753_c4_g17_i1::g.39317::m.39317